MLTKIGGKMVRTVPVSEAKQHIRELVEEAEQNDAVFYIARYSRPKAVMLGVGQYEALIARINLLEEHLAQAMFLFNERDEGPLMIPKMGGGWQIFDPGQPISPELRQTLREAAHIAWERRHWTRERFVAAGERDLARAQADAIARGVAIHDEREAAYGD